MQLRILCTLTYVTFNAVYTLMLFYIKFATGNVHKVEKLTLYLTN
jgi:hypothetical protein